MNIIEIRVSSYQGIFNGKQLKQFTMENKFTVSTAKVKDEIPLL